MAKFVFKVSAFRLDTRAQTGAPLYDCHINYLVKFTVTSRTHIKRSVFVYVSHACVGLQHGEVVLVGLKPILRTTTSFSALTLSVGSFDP